MENIPPETCPWSLSGPQFPQPTAIQQRYCYPKGRPEYSSRKGGALWTMYGADGKEDVEFRLLHVYFSAKRAINKGMSSIAENEPIYYPKSTPSQPLDRVASKRLRASPQRAQPQPHQNQFLHSPAITTSSANSTSLSGSPLSFDVLPPCASPNYSENTGENSNSSSTIYPTWPEQLIVTPINDLLPRHPHSPVQRQANHADSSEESSYAGRLTPSPFRLPIRTPPSTINVTNSPLLRTGEYTVPLPGDDFDFYEAESVSSHDAFHNEALDFPLQHEIDSFWNDPFMTIMLKPSHDADFRSGDDLATEQLEDSFSSRLDVLQDSIRDRILAAPESRQPKLVSLMASWARKMADDPLAKSTMSHTTAVPSHRASKNDDENDESYSYEPTVDDGSDDKPTASGF